MSEVDRFFFDLFALDYYEEELAKARKEAIDKQKFEQEHKMDAPMSFEAHQDLLSIARENSEQTFEGEDE
jgi:hypothetical protein